MRGHRSLVSKSLARVVVSTFPRTYIYSGSIKTDKTMNKLSYSGASANVATPPSSQRRKARPWSHLRFLS
jgi:hypothetical protein